MANDDQIESSDLTIPVRELMRKLSEMGVLNPQVPELESAVKRALEETILATGEVLVVRAWRKGGLIRHDDEDADTAESLVQDGWEQVVKRYHRLTLTWINPRSHWSRI
jgi:hypothetical protein